MCCAVIEVAIKRNHDGGCDARVRGLKIIGGRYVQINELITAIYYIHFIYIWMMGRHISQFLSGVP